VKRLAECVPNFSEGRDASKVDAIVAAMQEVPGVLLLGRESDPDHNRSVITLAGEPEALAEAAVRGVGKAAQLIDLTRHTGAHPRLGATDVVPFIPIAAVTLEECVTLAKWAGAEIWKRFRVPVYFYEAAATKPERVNLENIRRGQFEGLREEAPQNPERAPDIGGPDLHPRAGATAVGARKFLIAYNINLKTQDVSVAKDIATKIRFSRGGFPFVKAMGLMAESRGLAQVSMNLTDFEQTPIHKVYTAVKQQGAERGVEIEASEIVGLVPRRAIEMTAESCLKLENFSAARVLENRLEDALALQIPARGTLAVLVQPFLDAVSRPSPTPGGGSVAALAGSLAAALGEMVAGLSSRKKSQAAHAETLREITEQFRNAKQDLASGIDLDAASYEQVLAARHLPQALPDEKMARERAIQSAFKGAIEAPLAVARRASSVSGQLRQLEAIASPSMISDVRVGQWMASTAVRGALENVRINLEFVTDAEFVSQTRSEADELAKAIADQP